MNILPSGLSGIAISNNQSILLFMTELEQKYKAICFDYGGVLKFFGSENPALTLARFFDVPMDGVRTEYLKRNHLHNVDGLPLRDVWSLVIDVYTTDATEKTNALALIDERLSAEPVLNTKLIAFLPRLRDLGYKISILSNYTTDLRGRLQSEGITDLVDEVVISAEVGYHKPSIEIFDILCSRLQISPKELVFIDDSEASLVTASEIGYTPILFLNNEQLFEDLKNLDIL